LYNSLIIPIFLINHTNLFMNKLYGVMTRVSTTILYMHWTSIGETLKQFLIPNSKTLKQSIGEGRKNWRIDWLTLPYLITRGERKSELMEELIPAILGVKKVIPASWISCEPLGLGYQRFRWAIVSGLLAILGLDERWQVSVSEPVTRGWH